MIYSPCYNGKHNIIKYEELKNKILEILLVEKDIELDIDFLYEEELSHYFNHIFFSQYYILENNKNIELKIYSKDKARLRKIRQIVRRLRINYTDIKHSKFKHYITINNYG